MAVRAIIGHVPHTVAIDAFEDVVAPGVGAVEAQDGALLVAAGSREVDPTLQRAGVVVKPGTRHRQSIRGGNTAKLHCFAEFSGLVYERAAKYIRRGRRRFVVPHKHQSVGLRGPVDDILLR